MSERTPFMHGLGGMLFLSFCGASVVGLLFFWVAVHPWLTFTDADPVQTHVEAPSRPESREQGWFGCSLATTIDLDGDGLRELVIADTFVPVEGRRGWGVWIVSPRTGKVIAERKGAYRESSWVSLTPLGDVDREGTPDLGLITRDMGIRVLCGRDLGVLVEVEPMPGIGQAESMAWLGWDEAASTAILALASPGLHGDTDEQRGGISCLELGGKPLRSRTSVLRSGEKTGVHLGGILLAVGDMDGDGRDDLLIGRHGGPDGPAELELGSGKDAAVLRVLTCAPAHLTGSAAMIGDVDGDGLPECAVGCYAQGRRDVAVLSPWKDEELHRIRSQDVPAGQSLASFPPDGEFGAAIAPMADIDGDGIGEIAISAPEAYYPYGAVLFCSGKDGKLLREVIGYAEDVKLGCALTACDDLDGDGIADLVVGMGSHTTLSNRGGVVILSAKTGKRLARFLRSDMK